MSALPRLLPTLARVVLGLVFTVFGLNGFLNVLPSPEVPAAAGAYLAALAATGYMFPLIKGLEVVSGVLLLTNRYVPLALTLLAPILVNVALFHRVLAPFSPMVALLVGAELLLVWAHRDAFRVMFEARGRRRGELEPAGRTAPSPG